jgi:hypothetical protein
MRTRILLVFIFLYIGLIVLSTTSLLYGSDGDQIPVAPNTRSFVIVENTDADIYVVNGQHARFFANYLTGQPIPLPGYFFALKNNVWTDTNQFLQNGFSWFNGSNGGRVTWNSTATGLTPQPYPNMPYVGGRTYLFEIGGGSGTTWNLCATDLTNLASRYCVVANNSGTYASPNINTSIFIENSFPDYSWTNQINGNFKVEGVREVRGGLTYYWGSVHRHTAHACSGSYPPIFNTTTNIGAIKGTPVNNGSVAIKKNGVPPLC